MPEKIPIRLFFGGSVFLWELICPGAPQAYFLESALPDHFREDPIGRGAGHLKHGANSVIGDRTVLLQIPFNGKLFEYIIITSLLSYPFHRSFINQK